MRTVLAVKLLGCVPLVFALGCGANDGRMKVYPVSGKVVVKGQPAAGAMVTFYCDAPEFQQKVPPPTGTVDGGGAFRLTTYKPEDGAPAGDYKVTVVWPEPPPANAKGIFDTKDRLRGKYGQPQTSKLTAHVETGGGDLPPFNLD